MLTAENLCLHYVASAPPLRRFTLAADELEQLVSARLAKGQRVASLADYLEGNLEPSAFTVSFDDAHESVLRVAFPRLARLGIRATVFVPTDYVGTSDEFMDWSDLALLRDAGWTIGSHSASHRRMRHRLYDEDPAAHRQRLIDDAARSRDALHRELDLVTTMFAYPYGDGSEPAASAIESAGFRLGFTVSNDREWSGERLSIPRVEPRAAIAREPEGPPLSLSVIVPARDRASILADVVTRLASQTYPKDRYEVLVVDDGSEHDLRPIFEEMPSNVRLIPCDPSARGGDFRAGQARQRGADQAAGSHLVFLDADVAVEEDFLWHVEWVHAREPSAVLLGYLSGYNLHDLGYLHTPDAVLGRPLAEEPIIEDRSREPTLRRCLDNLDWLEDPWPLTYTGNLSVEKALFDRSGGFDRTFVGWGLEDVDLGIRLHRAGGRFLFSRFALGRHIVDPSEGPSRNPFRRKAPALDDFAGYLRNLDHLASQHATDVAVADYVARAHSDIEETCGRPMTVGIEFGGAARTRTPYHGRLHHLQPGGVAAHELLDRVAYAEKIAAKTIFLLGGAPSEHPAFLEVVRAASRAASWVSMQTLGYPFAAPGLAARAREAGLRGAVLLVLAFDQETYEALHGEGTFDAFVRGVDALSAAGVELSARFVVTREGAPTREQTRRALEERGIRIDEVEVTDPGLLELMDDATLLA